MKRSRRTEKKSAQKNKREWGGIWRGGTQSERQQEEIVVNV